MPFAKTLIDTMLFYLNFLLPCQLPPAVAAVALKYDHNLLIECADYGGGEAAAFEAKLAALAAADQHSIVYHCCADDAEVQAVKRFRFVGNPSFRTWCVGHGLQVGGPSPSTLSLLACFFTSQVVDTVVHRSIRLAVVDDAQ